MMIVMGENPEVNMFNIESRPSIEITITNITLNCENCGLIEPEGIISLRPRSSARFICLRCLKLNIDKIKYLKKSGNIEQSHSCSH